MHRTDTNPHKYNIKGAETYRLSTRATGFKPMKPKSSKPYKYKRPLLKKGDTVIVSARPEHAGILRDWSCLRYICCVGTVDSDETEYAYSEILPILFYNRADRWFVPKVALVKL